ncbi:hypothetical protein CONLIGDRAFT_173523 [Coniochaeta ligniaria NRRL 30616]|uniref:Uncharacterized protein n=1 Tax=Coniochaeta ligniaria NRRL 30616 TaxID=1408157 RepID=A0A1J7J1K6_9PEZI|nr:hypothetical protein CONLIGDRAFT_173523 [Coniochaeta ligniaria NRRL 30616]
MGLNARTVVRSVRRSFYEGRHQLAIMAVIFTVIESRASETEHLRGMEALWQTSIRSLSDGLVDSNRIKLGIFDAKLAHSLDWNSTSSVWHDLTVSGVVSHPPLTSSPSPSGYLLRYLTGASTPSTDGGGSL